MWHIVCLSQLGMSLRHVCHSAFLTDCRSGLGICHLEATQLAPPKPNWWIPPPQMTLSSSPYCRHHSVHTLAQARNAKDLQPFWADPLVKPDSDRHARSQWCMINVAVNESVSNDPCHTYSHSVAIHFHGRQEALLLLHHLITRNPPCGVHSSASHTKVEMDHPNWNACRQDI